MKLCKSDSHYETERNLFLFPKFVNFLLGDVNAKIEVINIVSLFKVDVFFI